MVINDLVNQLPFKVFYSPLLLHTALQPASWYPYTCTPVLLLHTALQQQPGPRTHVRLWGIFLDAQTLSSKVCPFMVPSLPFNDNSAILKDPSDSSPFIWLLSRLADSSSFIPVILHPAASHHHHGAFKIPMQTRILSESLIQVRGWSGLLPSPLPLLRASFSLSWAHSSPNSEESTRNGS